MQTRHKLEIERLSHLTPNVEICGLTLLHGDGSVILQPCNNVSTNPEEDFVISQIDYINAARTGKVLWVYHSHPHHPSFFSEADIDFANENGIPQWMYSLETKSWHEYIPPSHFIPLEGRQFIWGEQDCFSLFRDYFRQNFQIYIRDYDRDETSSWPELGQRVLQHIEIEGFKIVPSMTTVQKHDILILRTNGSPQHFAIFQGNSWVLHHPLGGLSRKDLYGAAWQRRLHCIVRYNNRSLS